MSVSEPQPRTELTVGEEKTNDSDTDSGKGSCGLVSPHSNKETCHSDKDSDEEIFPSKKMTRKPLQESDSDGEASNINKIGNAESDGKSENEERNLNISAVDKSKKLRRVRRLMLDSDESDSDALNSEGQVRMIKSSCVGSVDEKLSITETQHKSSDSESSSVGQQKSKCSQHHKERADRKEKSQRRREKAQKRLEVVEKLKRKKKKQEKLEESTEFEPADDSGCLLNNSDLFETEMDDENELVSEEEELSLDAIRAAVKKKAKQSKSMKLGSSAENLQDYDCEESLLQKDEKKVRTERKAAKQSKEAMRQIHSETQRLMREANLGLPYHLPQPKTIHDFFKKRPRPACKGSAMSLLKSAKYQPCLLQETSNSTTEIETLNAIPQGDGLLDQLVRSNESATTVQIPEIEEPHLNVSNNQENISPNPLGSEIQVEKNEGPVETIEQLDFSTDLESKEQDCVNAEHSTKSDHYSFCLELAEETGSSEKLTIMPENSHVELDKIVPDTVVKLSSDMPSLTEEEQKQLEAASKAKQRKSKLDKLRVLGVDLTLKPRLCADEGAFVNLEEPKENKELQALKERFLKHGIKPVKQNQERHVELNVIRKITNADGKEELKADSVAITLGTKEVEEFGPTKPGEKLQVLKAKLQEAMKLRRIEERQKRQALYKLDNEQGFEDEEDEEEELTESEEEDPESVEFLLGDGEEAGVEADDDTQSTDAAQNQDLVTQKESTPKPVAVEFSQSIKSGTASSFKMGEQTSGNKLRLQLQQTPPKGDSKLDEDDSTSQASTTKENSHNSSFELIGSMIPSYQPSNKQPGRFGVAMLGGFRSPSPNLFNPNSQFKTSFISSASKSSGKLSEPSMPVEDSQDLYNTSPEPKNSTSESQFRFSLEDETQSQLLDADGFLNVGHRSNKWQLSKRQLILDNMDENAMDANMGELLGFCSGEFKSQNLDTLKEKNKEKEQNIDELLGLCSGKFVSPESSSSISSALKQQKAMTTASDDLMTEVLALCSGSFPTDREDDEENEDGQFQLLTDDEVFESEDDKSSGEEGGEKEEDEEEQMAQEVLMKRKLKLKDFVEDEAELSGSDMASDDECDVESDEYEEDVIEEDLPSDEELQEQVNKIHMKVLMDEDKRQLRLYQEQYLADGDLHSDGPGRARKFRWKNIDDSSQTDLFRGDSEDEPDEEVDEAEVNWRKDRFEREQWLREQSQDAGSEEEVGEDSQFMKLAKKITVKALQKGSSMEVVPEKKPQESMRLEPQKPSSVFWMKNGSLLNRPREVLQKLAAISDVNLNAPRANSRNFVFHTLSPEKNEKKTTKSKPQTKRKATATPMTSLAKRPRTEKTPTNSTHTRSIFRYLEK
ncbi:claspin isoform X2 [Heterodontus francisci]|uniref:claspin isoform X2 n=1 Tax=Heterodontus francisci TaxID=7792 RepID=UPI00355C15A3